MGKRAPELLGAFGWTVADSEELEADDVMYSFARAEQRRGRAGAAAHRRPRPLRGGRASAWRCSSCARGAVRSRSARPGCASATAWSPRRSPTSSRCAATPPTGCPGAPGIGAKTAAELLRQPRLARGTCSPRRPADRRPRQLAPAHGRALLRQRRAAARFKQIATLQRDRRAPPRDRATDFAGGARDGARSSGCAAWPSAVKLAQAASAKA